MRAIFAILLIVLSGAGHAVAAEPLANQPYVVAYDGRIAAQMMINGQGPFTLLLDTGSSQTILFSKTAARLQLLPAEGQQIHVHSIADSAMSQPYKLRELAFGEERIANLMIAVLPGPDENVAGPDGVLGVDVLTRYAVVLDHREGRMKLFPRAGGVPAPYNAWRFVDLSPRRLKDIPVDFWFFEARYGDQHVMTLFDLGTGVTILTWQLARRLIPWRDMPSKNDDEVRDALGAGLPAFRLEGLNIEVARRVWHDQIALVADAPVFEFLEFGDRPPASSAQVF